MEKIVKLGIIGIVIVFTLFAFVFEQPCGTYDRNLWCYVHPFKLLDLVGCILFYGGFVLMFVMDYLDTYAESVGGASLWAWIYFAMLAVGAGLMFV